MKLVPTREEMNNEEIIDKAPTAREVIAKAGGKIESSKGIVNMSPNGLYICLERWTPTSYRQYSCAFRSEPIDALLSVAYSQFRAAEDAKWEEVECPNIDWKYDEEHPSDCTHCKGTRKLYRRIEAKENGS